MKFEISRRTIAEPLAAFCTGAISGFRNFVPAITGGLMTGMCWKVGAKKTAVLYAALTVGSIARLAHGFEAEVAADEEFQEMLAAKIAGPAPAAAEETK